MDNLTEEQKKERLELLEASLALTKTGYAGIDRNCKKVDRREFPDAIPLQENPLLRIPKPKPVYQYECCSCGWKGFHFEKDSKREGIWEAQICPECGKEDFYRHEYEPQENQES